MIKGSIVALITPFHEDGSVNFEKLGELLEMHVASGTDGILVLGTTGESSTMSHEEDDSVVKYTIEKINHRLPVVVGAGSNDTQTAIDKSIKYSVHIPVIMYNVPGRTGCKLSEHAVQVLSKHPNICGIKEASGDISYVMNISRYLNDDFVMYSGNDDMVIPVLSAGGSGVISVFANTNPKECHEMVTSWLAGDHQKGLSLQQKYLDYIHALFCEVNPIPVKEALNLMGKEVGGYRLPLYPMEPKNRQHLKEEMQKVGIIE